MLLPVNRLDGIAERFAAPRLDLDERHHPLSLGNKIDVTVSASVAALKNTPALPSKPALRDFLSLQAQLLPLCRHDTKLRPLRGVASSFHCNT